MNYFGSPVATATLVVALVAATSLIWGSVARRRDHESKRFPTFPLMVFVASACSAFFLIFYSFAFQEFTFYPLAPDAASAPGPSTSSSWRVPAITVAAGLFGGFLFIAFTVLKYRGHVQADERLSLERGASSLRTSEHYGERFARAAEMLGSDRAATRLGGVYALAALADEWLDNRQQCVDLLCGYMRTPIPRSTSSSSEPDAGPTVIPSPRLAPRTLLPRPQSSPVVSPAAVESFFQSRAELADAYAEHAATDEVEVRKAVLASIARGTSRTQSDVKSWSGMTFDLSRCFIEGLDFQGCSFAEKVDFNGTIFSGSTNLRNTYFAKNAQFDGCTFLGRTWFSGATFAGHAWFRAAEFRSEVRFGRTKFQGAMVFNFAKFCHVPHFSQNELGSAAGQLTEIPYANWDGVDLRGDMYACPDMARTFWDEFISVQKGYTVICELPHPPKPLSETSAPPVP